MLEKNGDGIVFLLEFAAKRPFPNKGIDHPTMSRRSRVTVRNLIDCTRDTRVPLFGVTYRKQHFGIWIGLHEILVKSASRPVYSCLIPLEDRLPIGRCSFCNGLPLFRRTWFVKEFCHVVTRTKA